MTSMATIRNNACARSSFEKTIGKQVMHATEADLVLWLHSLRAEGYAINTCRTYLSLVRQMTHLKNEAPLPKREQTEKRTLSDDEIKNLLSAAGEKDYAWVAAMLLCGPDVLAWRFQDLYTYIRIVPMALYDLVVADAERRGFSLTPIPYRGRLDAHWINGWHEGELIWTLDFHKANRQLKRAAGKAGIGTRNMNVTTMRYTHERLMKRYHNADRAAKALGIEPTQPKPARKASPQLHGMGRRSFSIKTA